MAVQVVAKAMTDSYLEGEVGKFAPVRAHVLVCAPHTTTIAPEHKPCAQQLSRVWRVRPQHLQHRQRVPGAVITGQRRQSSHAAYALPATWPSTDFSQASGGDEDTCMHMHCSPVPVEQLGVRMVGGCIWLWDG